MWTKNVPTVKISPWGEKLENLKLFQTIVPESVELIKKRFNILKNIFYNEPIGRRNLSQLINLSERTVRTELEFFKNNDFILMSNIGVSVTEKGKELFLQLIPIMDEILDIQTIEEKLQNILDIKKVIVIPGDIDQDKNVLKEMGTIAAENLKEILSNDTILALMGGSSVKAMVDYLPNTKAFKNITVVPGRGGIGNAIETQANTLVSRASEKLNGSYKVIHVPDRLSEESKNALLKEEEINKVNKLIINADILVCGVGRADTMGNRRNLPKNEIELLDKLNAKGESCGAYFNSKGEVILKSNTLGLSVDDIKHLKNVLVISGGKKKAEAVLSVRFNNKNTIFITDEACANEILELKAVEP